MKTLTLAAALLIAVPAYAQDAQALPQQTPEEQQKQMELMGPGPEHATLAALAGTWEESVTFNMGGPTIKSTGRAVNTMVLGGRFLKTESRNADPASGLNIESLSLFGFDRRTGEYTVVGFDTMGTYYVTGRGKREAGAQQVAMQGEVDETIGGQSMRMKYDMVLRWIDADHYGMDIIFHTPQGDMTVAELRYTRVK